MVLRLLGNGGGRGGRVGRGEGVGSGLTWAERILMLSFASGLAPMSTHKVAEYSIITTFLIVFATF